MSYNPPVGDATVSTKGLIRLSGDLGGTAAAPTVAASAVTAAKIADGVITEPKLAIFNSPTTNYVLSWNGSAMAWASTPGSSPTYATVPTGSTFTVYKPTAGSWPGARPSARTDIYFIFKGSGTAGTGSSPESIMIDGDDWQILP